MLRCFSLILSIISIKTAFHLNKTTDYYIFKNQQKDYNNGQYFTIFGTIGTPSKYHEIALDITAPITYVYQHIKYYNSTTSFTYKYLNRSIYTHLNEEGHYSKEMITLDNFYYFCFNKMYFALLKEYNQRPNNTVYLGLGRGNDSFIHQLKSEGFINKTMFQFTAQSFILDEDKSIDNNSIIKCDLIDFGFQYACKLSSVLFIDKSRSLLKIRKVEEKKDSLIGKNMSITFSSLEQNIVFPLNKYVNFKLDYFGKELKNSLCKEYYTDDGRYRIHCSKKGLEDLKEIIFIIWKNKGIVLNSNDLFVPIVNCTTEFEYRFLIDFIDKSIVDDNTIVFGYHMIYKFQMIFSEDEKYIGFIKTKNIQQITNKSDNNSVVINAIYSLIIFDSIGIMLICISKVYIKRTY